MILGLYNALLFIFSPFLRIYFYARYLCGKDTADGIRNHFGTATVPRPKGPLIWIHAVSIGESVAALTYVNHLKKQFPQLNVLLTTITVTSADLAAPKIAKINGCCHQFAPTDRRIWTERFLNRWKPCAAFFLESEIWPNTADLLSKRKIPIFLLNARLSPKSFRRWKILKSFFKSILEKFTCILAQSDIDFERFSFFSPKNTKRIDNLKYANDPLPCNEDLLEAFQKACNGRKVFVAASTHEGEEEIILEARKKLKKDFDPVTVIIPRHTIRAGKIREMLENQGVKFAFRSEDKFPDDIEVLCADTFGEVGTFFRAADVCFVGGSLTPTGGHNIYEPAVLGKPVLHGPFTDNITEAKNLLGEKQIAFEVRDSEEIARVCRRLMSDPEKLRKIAEVAPKIARNDSLKQIDAAVELSKILAKVSF
ncbi:MAG: 3-deoxy-D-manno-octulosonic acid transferase [Holosporaceae bacterium]|jgi:3-deoxy-D-manno-octulosonic-acid transferase|nr:3-deoxy-D-manno-octulosonic acid transferase [Holosporaceae bacterium]